MIELDDKVVTNKPLDTTICFISTYAAVYKFNVNLPWFYRTKIILSFYMYNYALNFLF